MPRRRVQLPDFRPAYVPYLGNGRYRSASPAAAGCISILVGLNIALLVATLFYRATSFSQHPTYSLICILAVIVLTLWC